MGSNGTQRFGFIGEGSEASAFNGVRNNKYYTGKLDELRMWDRALSLDEINANRTHRLNGCEDGLLLYFDFNEGMGTELYDKATRTYAAFTGTINWESTDAPLEDCAAPTEDGNPLLAGVYEYRYGFNGMEKDDEVKGSGNHVDFGARGYDPRLGRWLSVDPLSGMYPKVSPYSFGLNNPIIVVDIDGREILLIFEKTYEDQNGTLVEVYKGKDVLEGIINDGLGGQFQVKLEPVGGDGRFMVKLEPTEGGGDISKLTEKQQAFYTNLNDVAETADALVVLNVGLNDEEVIFGSYERQKIDVGDMKAAGPNDENSIGGTSQGYLIHEVIEQYQSEIDGTDKTDPDKILKDFDKQHKAAVEVENKVNGNERLAGRGKGLLNLRDPAGKTQYKEPDGSTTSQTHTTNTKEMKVTKENSKR